MPSARTPVVVPSEVLEGIEAVRQTGLTNMLDRPAVVTLARRLGFYRSAEWVERNTKSYAEGVFRGFATDPVWPKCICGSRTDRCKFGAGKRTQSSPCPAGVGVPIKKQTNESHAMSNQNKTRKSSKVHEGRVMLYVGEGRPGYIVKILKPCLDDKDVPTGRWEFQQWVERESRYTWAVGDATEDQLEVFDDEHNPKYDRDDPDYKVFAYTGNGDPLGDD